MEPTTHGSHLSIHVKVTQSWRKRVFYLHGIPRSATVWSVKKMIQEREGDPPENRILRFHNRRHEYDHGEYEKWQPVKLENDRTLADYNFDCRWSEGDLSLELAYDEDFQQAASHFPTPPTCPADEATICSAFSIIATIGGRAKECVPVLLTCRTLYHDAVLIRLTDAALFRLRDACRVSDNSPEHVRELLLPVCELAASNPAILDDNITPALISACEYGSELVACEVMRWAPDDGRDAALVIAAALDRVEVIRCAVARGADVNASRHYSTRCSTGLYWTHGLSPLHAAARGGKVAAVRSLLALGARVDVTGEAVLLPPRIVGDHDFLHGGGAPIHAATPLASVCAPVVPFDREGQFVFGRIYPEKAIVAMIGASPASDALTALFWTCRYLEDPLVLVALLARVPFTLPQLWAAAMHAASPLVLSALLRKCRFLASSAMCLLDVNTRVAILPECVPACSGWRALTTTTHGSTLLDRMLDRFPCRTKVVQALLDAGAVPTRGTLLRATVYGCIKILPSLLAKCREPARFVTELRFGVTLLERVCWLRARSSALMYVSPLFFSTVLQRALQLNVLSYRNVDLEDPHRSCIPCDSSLEESVRALLAHGAIPTPLALCGAFQSRLSPAAIAVLLDACGSLQESLHAPCDLSWILRPSDDPVTVNLHTDCAIDIALRVDVAEYYSMPSGGYLRGTRPQQVRRDYYPELLRRGVILTDAHVRHAFINAPLCVIERIAVDYKDAVQRNGTVIVESLCELLAHVWGVDSVNDNGHGNRGDNQEKGVLARLTLLLSTTVGAVASIDALRSVSRIIVRRSTTEHGRVRWISTGSEGVRLQLIRALLTRGAGIAINDVLADAGEVACELHGGVPSTLLEKACCHGLFDIAETLLELGAKPSVNAFHCLVLRWGRGDLWVDRSDASLFVRGFVDGMRRVAAQDVNVGGTRRVVLDLNMVGPTGLTLLEAVLEAQPDRCCYAFDTSGPQAAVAYLMYSGARLTSRALFLAGVTRSWACRRHQFVPHLVSHWIATRVCGEIAPEGVAYAAIAGPVAAGPGVALDIYDPEGVSLLYRAAAAGREEFCSLLLTFGARADIRNTDGSRSTPLHAAAAGRLGSIVTALMLHGADPLVPDANGLLPDLAWTAEHTPGADGGGPVEA